MSAAAASDTRTRPLRKHAWLFVLGGLAIALAMAGVADAYWTATGTGGGSGPVGTLNAPTISSATPGAGTATLTWSAVTPPGSGSVSYYVQRNGGSPVGNCPTQAAPTSVLTCTDSGLAKGTYTYTVTAVWRSWTVTSSPAQVTLASGAPHHFVLSAATTTPTAGQADNLTITAVDAAGNTVIGYTGSHSLTFSGAGTIGSFSPTVTNKSGAAINFGTATAITFANGVAAVSAGSNGAMTLYKAGTVTVSVTDTSISGTSASITIGAAAANKLSFTQSPGDTTAGVAFASQPKVTVQDQYGNTVTSDTSSVTIAVTGGAATLSGCAANPTAATAGVATFGGCTITTAGTYTLTATDGSLTSAVSGSFTIGPAAANKLSFTQSPGNTVAGVAFASQPQVTVQDQYGNTVTSDTSSVTIAVTGGAATLSGCAANPEPATAGVATFGGCTITTAGTYTLTATDGSLTSAVSGSFTITAATNISQGRPVTCSSIEQAAFACAYAVDGNAGTRWSSAFSDPQWIYVDLGQSHNITQVVLMWETAYGKSFQIQTSNDLTNWTTIYSTTTGTGGTQTLNSSNGLSSGSGRYVRMYGTVRSGIYGYSLYEFQVFGG